jgi:putative endonuclease
MARIHRRGRRGEALVAAHLERHGWRILARNWRFHHKELDLVAEKGGVVAFVEVKTRAADGLGHPLESITARKRHDLATAARGWIAEHGRSYESFRFDAAVVVTGSGGTNVDHIEDAWRV